MYEVKDGARTLKFHGSQLAASSSRHKDSQRWIEFELYRTLEGQYVLSRVGVSLVYHRAICPLVSRYGLHESAVDDIDRDAYPCEECRPNFQEPVLFPEKYRYWTLVSADPEAVLDALYKQDRNSARYLTKVAQRLLDEASEVDSDIDSVYRIEFIA